MESNARRRRRDPAVGMQEMQPIDQPQIEPKQELPMQENRLLPAYQRRQAANRQAEQTTQPMTQPVQPVSRTAMEQSVYQRPVSQPVAQPAQPVRRTAMEQNVYQRPMSQTAMEQSAYQRPVVQPVPTAQAPVRSMPVQPMAQPTQPIQPAVRQRRTTARPVQIDDEPVQMQSAYMPESEQKEEAPVLRTTPAKKTAEPKADIRKKKKEKLSVI